jgi:RHH-type proline utilization regulon transcriptional repressor/proline dehydrogenase/delta 1-pyrroline-5-carboxylate dehydrogenase
MASTIPSPFYAFAQGVQAQSALRAAITSAYRLPETECLPPLIEEARMAQCPAVGELAQKLTALMRNKRKAAGVDSLLQEFDLSSQEGVALMCLAEALLRIPDMPTRDALIRDKLGQGDWKSHIGASPSLFVNAAAWGLMLTGKLLAPHGERSLPAALTSLLGKGSEAMQFMGDQFVAGQSIAAALHKAREGERRGFSYSYDMLGEAAMATSDAQRYYAAYEHAIHAVGKREQGRGVYKANGISIKLSALHPRYSRAQRDRVLAELLPRITALAGLARHYDIGLNIDAEEADRLELSLDLFEALCLDPALSGWDGLGFVVQAYQKRAPFVIDYLIDLAQRSAHRLMIRLVKGAYWDTEIKRAQIDGLEGYPVYTRKVYTDISYLACAGRLLAAPRFIYPQFATHNAHTVAAIYHLSGAAHSPGQYEFQCLYGMGESLYEVVSKPVEQGGLNLPCRVYAPVGTHETLLPYLVRRLLENGANTSFVNQLADAAVPLETLVEDPVDVALRIHPLGAPHGKIPLPRGLYLATGGRINSAGLDLSNEHQLATLSGALLHSVTVQWRAYPRVPGLGLTWEPKQAQAVRNPADQRDIVGHVMQANEAQTQAAISAATEAASAWATTAVHERARCLRQAADILEGATPSLLGLIVREAGKSLSNAISEVREAVDFLRYYAQQIEVSFSNDTHHPLGAVVCISPWNFPLAIFMGQVAAALAAGNTVLAKPAEQTCLIAAQAVSILHQAGVPEGAVLLVPGSGETVGAALVASPAVQGVVFTGSTQVAKSIACTLANRLNKHGQPVPFIAETAGQNAMVVDSSALPEQVVADVLTSAFDSAGQRCSALRLLCVQDDCADHVFTMLRHALQELALGNPEMLSVDVGPVIDAEAAETIRAHVDAMAQAGHKIDRLRRSGPDMPGFFVEPTIIEIEEVSSLKKEVFGPVLHVMRYERDALSELVDAINQTGYGLTFGVQTRLDETMEYMSSRVHAGNIYVNRNIVGAVVGVQPFGGEGLSGTGPKAGGPLYLLSLLSGAPAGMPMLSDARHIDVQRDAAQREASRISLDEPVILTGPTGESNRYYLKPKGIALCLAASETGAKAQFDACIKTGNTMALLGNPAAQLFLSACSARQRKYIQLVSPDYIAHGAYQAVLFEGGQDALRELNLTVAQRPGPIVPIQGRDSDALARGRAYRLERLLREVSVSINTAAAGGNATLMTLG